METEVLELIATRVAGKGDTWVLVGEDVERASLTEALEEWFQLTEEKCHFRLEPLNGKLFAIKTEETQPEPPKKYSIYGSY
jgi:hypothetical protein